MIVHEKLNIADHLGGGPAKGYRIKYVHEFGMEFECTCDDNGKWEIDLLLVGDYTVFAALPLKALEANKDLLEKVEADPDLQAIWENKKDKWEQINPGTLHIADELEIAINKWEKYFENNTPSEGELK